MADGPDAAAEFLRSALHTFRAMKKLGEGAIRQCPADALDRAPEGAGDGNSIAVIVRHLRGNMISRWTDFLSSDGEKPWRDRDGEFEAPAAASTHADVLACWEEGWRCVFSALEPLGGDDAMRTVTIRGEAHTVIEAVNRQISHYGYHIGQIVLLARMAAGPAWQSLSIPRGESNRFSIAPPPGIVKGGKV